MKLVDSVIITEIANEKMLVEVNSKDPNSFNGIVKLNETAAFVAEALLDEITLEELVNKVNNEYEGVSKEQIFNDVTALIDKLTKLSLIYY